MSASGKINVANADAMFDSVVAYLTDTSATEGRDWTIVKDWRSESTPENKIVLSNNGLSGGSSVFVGLYDKNIDGNKHVLYTKVYSYWDDTMDFWTTVYGSAEGYGTTNTCIPHWDATMDYWLYTNGKRIILVLKTQNRYGMAYLGSLLSFLPSNEYPQPLVCTADGYSHKDNDGYLDDYDAMFFTDSYQSNEQNYRQGFPWVDPYITYVRYSTYYRYHGCNCILDQSGTWTPFFHTAPIKTIQTETEGLIISGVATYGVPGMGDNEIFYAPGEPTALLPLYATILSNNTGGVDNTYRCLAGMWEGVYWAPSYQLTAESTIDGDYTVFPNVDRTTWSNWIAIKEE